MHINARDPVQTLQAVSDPTRLRLLRLLMREEMNVQELVTVLELRQPSVSRHLAVLRDAGWVDQRREGTFSWYRAAITADPALQAAVAQLADQLAPARGDDGRLGAVIAEREARGRELFAGVADHWDRIRQQYEHPDLQIGVVAALVPRGLRVVDVGTGSGALLPLLAGSGAEVVAVYGGDGTVMEVASGLIGTETPLLILGGGTGNLVASELRLPTSLERACELVCGETYRTRHIDAGMIGDRPFLLRLGCGVEVGVVEEATRELKDQFGKWAYVFAGIKMLQEIPEADYRIVIDGGEPFESSGVACVVANAGTVGVGRLTLAPSVDVHDGRLDVFLLKKANIEGIVQLARKMMGLERLRRTEEEQAVLDASQLITHWSVETVSIETDPILPIQVDGDVVAETPQFIRGLPSALRVVV